MSGFQPETHGVIVHRRCRCFKTKYVFKNCSYTFMIISIAQYDKFAPKKIGENSVGIQGKLEGKTLTLTFKTDH